MVRTFHKAVATGKQLEDMHVLSAYKLAANVYGNR